VIGADRGSKFFGVSIDIAEQKALEEQFRHSQKMDAVGQLASGVAHDFNNLLTAILGYGEFAAEEAVSDRQRSDIAEIVGAAQRASRLTQQLLAFSRKQVLEPTRVDLNALVSEMGGLLRHLVGERIVVTTALGADVPVVRADVGQLEQVLLNLVVNARDAMPRGGALTIETSKVRLNAAPGVEPGMYARIVVTDTGVGMDAATKARLFEPFFTTKPRGQGTGLGLATADSIVRQSGGSISVDSEPDRGTTFAVYLPSHDATAVSVVQRRGRAKLANERVFVVEDEPPVRKLICTVLARAGYLVESAGDPDEAIARFEALDGPVDLVVADIVMPGGTGVDMMRKLRARKPSLRVLYVSGYTDQSVADETEGDPCAMFLAKPFTADVLARRVRDILDR
jgi:two-component system, cell cycle sensor histidine kinase and response regulator CckA